jgi:hypothetical protein
MGTTSMARDLTGVNEEQAGFIVVVVAMELAVIDDGRRSAGRGPHHPAVRPRMVPAKGTGSRGARARPRTPVE